MELPPFLTRTGDDKIVLTGHRVGLYHVIKNYKEGQSPEMLVEQFPTLSLALIHKVIAFYLENRAEVDQFLDSIHEAIERQAATFPMGTSIEELRRRMAQQRQAESA